MNSSFLESLGLGGLDLGIVLAALVILVFVLLVFVIVLSVEHSKLKKRMETTFQRVGLVKYDAFPQMGGKLSFSLAMLDEKYNGYIINSVHGSDGCYTYSKEIKAGRCDLELGEEEKKALGMAMQM